MHFITNSFKSFSKTNLTDPRQHVPLNNVAIWSTTKIIVHDLICCLYFIHVHKFLLDLWPSSLPSYLIDEDNGGESDLKKKLITTLLAVLSQGADEVSHKNTKKIMKKKSPWTNFNFPSTTTNETLVPFLPWGKTFDFFLSYLPCKISWPFRKTLPFWLNNYTFYNPNWIQICIQSCIPFPFPEKSPATNFNFPVTLTKRNTIFELKRQECPWATVVTLIASTSLGGY